MFEVDVVIIGAGPAGSSAAAHVKRLQPDARVVVLDKAEFPRDKPCGDGLGPHAVSEIVSLGAAGIFAGRVPVSKVRLVGPHGADVPDASLTTSRDEPTWTVGGTSMSDPAHPGALNTPWSAERSLASTANPQRNLTATQRNAYSQRTGPAGSHRAGSRSDLDRFDDADTAASDHS